MKCYEVRSERGDFNWCWFWTQKMFFKFLEISILWLPHFYSDWLWPYCGADHAHHIGMSQPNLKPFRRAWVQSSSHNASIGHFFSGSRLQFWTFDFLLLNRFMRNVDIAMIITVQSTLPFKMFGLGQKVLSFVPWSKFWPILANQ